MELIMVTLLFRKASARACAPKYPISLYARSSLTSLCINKEDDYHRYDMKIDITLLFFRASAIYCAPLSPIVLLDSSSLVSVFVHESRWLEKMTKRKWLSYYVISDLNSCGNSWAIASQVTIKIYFGECL